MVFFLYIKKKKKKKRGGGGGGVRAKRSLDGKEWQEFSPGRDVFLPLAPMSCIRK